MIINKTTAEMDNLYLPYRSHFRYTHTHTHNEKNENTTACAFQHVHSISRGVLHPIITLAGCIRQRGAGWGGTERHSLEVTHPVGGTVVTERRAKRSHSPSLLPLSVTSPWNNKWEREETAAKATGAKRVCMHVHVHVYFMWWSHDCYADAH